MCVNVVMEPLVYSHTSSFYEVKFMVNDYAKCIKRLARVQNDLCITLSAWHLIWLAWSDMHVGYTLFTSEAYEHCKVYTAHKLIVTLTCSKIQ